jgi:[ribosomal protein S5]-alanine N-acetyltransferase
LYLSYLSYLSCLSVMFSFETLRLRGETLTASHWAELRRMDTDEQLMATLGGVRDDAATAAYLEKNLAHWRVYGFGVWMLHDPNTSELLGRAIVRHLDLDGTDEVEIGYGFLPQHWGRGLATEAARECVRIGCDVVGWATVVAITRPDNAASQRVMAKAGLAYERDIVHAGVPHVLFRGRRPPS